MASELQNNGDYDYICVLDFEATCEGSDPSWQNEVIEFPIVVLDVKTATIVSEFREYVKPSLNPKLTEYCVDLTGITQDIVDAADDFPTVFKKVMDWYNDFLEKHPACKNIFLTCGDWDLRRMLPEQMKLCDMHIPPCFDQWINVKYPFAQLMNCDRTRVGMTTMLSSLNLPLIGRHHSGLDDSRNIAAIAAELMKRGVRLSETWTGGHKKNLIKKRPVYPTRSL